jgi:WD40 repeat protein
MKETLTATYLLYRLQRKRTGRAIITTPFSEQMCQVASTGHTDSVEAIAWSSDGQHLASGSVDKTVRVWDLSSSGNPYVFQNHTNEVYTVAWSPGGFPWPWSHEGQRLASGGKDTTVRLWQAV